MGIVINEFPIVGMCHLLPLPGDSNYDRIGGLDKIQNRALREITALQEGGVNAIIFSNEFSTPYNSNVSKTNVAAMSAIISNIKSYIKVPYGIDCMYDAKAAIDVAISVDANFIRGIFSVDYNSGINQVTINTREILIHFNKLNYDNKLELWCSLYPEQIELMQNMYSIDFETLIDRINFEISPNVICLHSKSIEKYRNTLNTHKKNKIKVYADGGCNNNNITMLKKHIDGLIIGTYLKYEHRIHNEVNYNEVKKFISQINKKDN